MNASIADEKQLDRPVRATSRWLRYLVGGGLTMVLVAIAAPTLISITSLRNSILGLIVNRPAMVSTADNASLGWTSEQRFDGLHIRDLLGGIDVTVHQLELDRTLIDLIFGLRPGGTVSMERPGLTIVVDKFQPDVLRPKNEPPQPGTGAKVVPVSLDFREGSFVVRDSQRPIPLVSLPHLSILLNAQPGENGWDYVASPSQIMDHTELTTDLCQQGMQLVAPILANTTSVSGRVSLRLNHLRIPLPSEPGDERKPEVDGHLDLHEVAAGVRDPLARQTSELISKVLGRPVPTKIKIADESHIHFSMGDGGVFHEGLAFGFPEISPDLQVHTSGFVGFDRTLDLQLKVPLPLTLIRDGPLMKKLSEKPLEFVVKGTLDEPQIALSNDRLWYEEMIRRVTESEPGQGASLEPLAEAIANTVGEMLENRRERLQNKAEAQADQGVPNAEGTGTKDGVLDRFRAWRDRRRTKASPQTDSDRRESNSPPDAAPAGKKGREF